MLATKRISMLNCKLILYKQIIRNMGKKRLHWAEIKRENFPRHKALQHFDEFYGTIFKDKWNSMRLGLLSEHKYCAVLNTFSDYEAAIQKLSEAGCINLRQHYYNKLEAALADKKQITDFQGVDESFVSVDDLKVPNENSNEDIQQPFDLKSLEQKALLPRAESEFMPVTKLIYHEDVVDHSSYYTFYDTTLEVPINVLMEHPIPFPQHLHVYMFPRGDISDFPPPKRDSANLLNYYLMDGASILPVLALDIQPGNIVADLCAAPGGKALSMLFTLHPEKIIMNDLSRMKRLKAVLSSYMPELDVWKEKIVITGEDTRRWPEYECYNKVLIDVPCTNDRLSAHENENNWFTPGRLQERNELPKTQMDILVSGLKTLVVGGSLVYSTCSFSPIQNDGVVHMSLNRIWEETRMEFIVKDLTDAMKPFSELYQFSNNCRYGQLVVPFVPSNFGPMYFCKLQRIK